LKTQVLSKEHLHNEEVKEVFLTMAVSQHL